MSANTNKRFAIEGDVARGTLVAGLDIAGTVHKEFELRAVTVEDMLDAEGEASVMQPLNYAAQLLVRQLVRVGEFRGPFTLAQIKRLKPVDWRLLRAAQTELDALGEAESASGAAD